MASFFGHPHGEPDDSGPEPRPGDTGAPELVGPVIFQSCDPCDDGSCGVEGCDHQSHDQEEFADPRAAVALMHRGCYCTAIPKETAP